ncbi:CpaF family protein [Fusibacter paucivorans]|uniref:CpaF family protein n=1 Tax=Fusibacter paucivorans TaxID=76009 RepID=A0ABS5PT28_9FIRM|nr:ATPase, T2SS/T4P/T4SS family [Fusibacter paucivorans]MBS7528243.1 CpaF family protein [Fusibacter paucivorans]
MSDITYQEISEVKEAILADLQVFDQKIIETKIDTIIGTKRQLSLTDKLHFKQRIINAIFHYDILQPLLEDPAITEIMINGPNHIFVERGGKLEPISMTFESEAHLMRIVDKIAVEIDRPINFSNPILDAHLSDGSRVNVVLNPIAKDGPVMTIRKFSEHFTDLSALVEVGMMNQEVADFLSMLITARYNFFISGGTGTGKTTLLNCLSSCIPRDERLITIEDARELNLRYHQNLISLETRSQGNASQTISVADLIKTALRMRPNRIIVGEVRGEEVNDMLQAMNTGHDGSMSTGHGNSPEDMLMRLESIASHHGNLSDTLIRKQIVSAIDFIVHIERLANGNRFIAQIAEIRKDLDHYQLIKHFDYDASHDVLQPISASEMAKNIANRRKLIRYEMASVKKEEQ